MLVIELLLLLLVVAERLFGIDAGSVRRKKVTYTNS